MVERATGRVVGIVGEGNAMRHFMSNRGSAFLQQRKRDFFSSLDGVLFYNHSFTRNDDYFDVQWRNKFNSTQKGREDHTLYFDAIGLKYRSEEGFGAREDFSDFVASCDVIIDGTGVYYESIKNVAVQIRKGEVDFSKVCLGLDACKADYKVYTERGVETDLRRFVDFSEFRAQWEMAYAILRTAAVVNQPSEENNRPFEIGWRILTELPGNGPALAKRGKDVAEVLNVGKVPPLYLNLVNEPCITSGLFVSNCPKMADYMIAVGGFDVARLKRVFAQEQVYQTLMKEVGISIDDLNIGLRGFHDQEVMIPHIGNRVAGSGAIEKLLARGIDYATMYHSLTKEVGQYWNNYNEDTGMRGKLDVNDEIDHNILDLAIHGMESRGKALSVFPSLDKDPLCNGVFQKVGQGNAGLFLMGSHRFRNGKVVLDE